MTTLHAASHQWATRPADERFTSLRDMADHFQAQRASSRELTIASRQLRAIPSEDHKGLMLESTRQPGHPVVPSHWAFGQLAQLAEAPAGYLRTIPSELAADCINYGLQYSRDVADVGMLLYRNGQTTARAITGPKYGRIWNSDIASGLVARFGNGTGDSDWRVPGEFGKQVEVTKANTTLFAGDRDMFVFLADEKNRVEVPNRRNGQPGLMARGFFVRNSEVGAGVFGVDTFLFDYVCKNRIVWGASQHKQVKIRHTPKAPVRWVEEIAPALQLMHEASTKGITDAILVAKDRRIDDVGEFLAKRFGKRMPPILQDIHLDEEQRPIETLWDASVAVTAHARSIAWQDDRVELERKAGELLTLAVS